LVGVLFTVLLKKLTDPSNAYVVPLLLLLLLFYFFFFSSSSFFFFFFFSLIRNFVSLMEFSQSALFLTSQTNL
jgi:hypothetical protein